MGAASKLGKAALKKKVKTPKAAAAGGGKRGNGSKKTKSVKKYMGTAEHQIHGVGDLAYPTTGRITPGGGSRRQGTAKSGDAMSLSEKNKLAIKRSNRNKKKYFESLPANHPERLKWEWNGLLVGAKRAIKLNIRKGKKSKFADLLKKKVIKKSGGTIKRKSGGKMNTDGNSFVAALYKGGKVGV